MTQIIGNLRISGGRSELLKSSDGLGWQGLVAERWLHDESEFQFASAIETKIILILTGRARTWRRLNEDVEAHSAIEGSIWLFASGVKPETIRLERGPCVCLHMYLRDGDGARPVGDGAATRRGLLDGGGFRDPIIEALGRGVARELDDGARAGARFVESVGATLDAYLKRRYASVERAKTSRSAARGALSPSRLGRALDLIDARLGDDLSLQDLARQTSLSVFHFARAFKAATGVSPHKYVLERRVQRASELIREQRLPLAELAALCGFASQAHLTNVFRRTLGVTPGALRAQTRKE